MVAKTDAGKEVAESSNKATHGFYLNKLFPCFRCTKNVNSSLFENNGRCSGYPVVDRFDVQRCGYEKSEFDRLLNHFFKHYEHLSEADRPAVERMVMIMIRLGRVESYMSDVGTVQAVPVFNPKTGETLWQDAQNVLKKDAYYDDRTIRNWLSALKLTKEKAKQPDKAKIDVALSFVD